MYLCTNITQYELAQKPFIVYNKAQLSLVQRETAHKVRGTARPPITAPAAAQHVSKNGAARRQPTRYVAYMNQKLPPKMKLTMQTDQNL